MPVETPELAPLVAGKRGEDIAAMFAGTARRYDLLNGLMTAGRHRAWRRAAVAWSGLRPGDRALDLCCGTGDFLLAYKPFLKNRGLVVGADFCEEMLRIGGKKTEGILPRPTLMRADALDLPFADQCFDAVTVGWGVRNVENPGRCLQEIFRVLNPGGRAVILESGWPANPVSAMAFAAFARFVLPLLGRALSDNPSAYRYLPESIRRFPARGAFLEIMRAAGFENLRFKPFGMGTVYMYLGVRPVPHAG